MKKSKALFYFTGSLILFVAIGAIAAGICLILKPDGSILGMPLDMLKNSPFKNFLIPGIVLFTVNGLGSLIGSLLCFKRHTFAGTLTIILGIAMVIWITAQVYWIGLGSWLQPTFFVVGVVEIILGILCNRRHLTQP